MIAPLFLIGLLGLLVACNGDDDADEDPTATSPSAATETATSPSAEDGSEDQDSDTTPTADGQAEVVTVEGEESVQLIQPPARSGDIPQGGRTLGSDTASVVLAEYGDFQ